MPDHATHVRRRTITITMSAPMPPMYHVANGALRESGATESMIAFGTMTDVTTASAETHRGRRAARREPSSVTAASSTSSGRGAFTNRHRSVVMR